MSNNYNIISDSALWDRLVKGDITAEEVLYKRYYELLFNYGIKFIRDEEFVKDCIQDLFIKLYGRTTDAHVEYVRAYLLKGLRNIMFDRYEAKIRMAPIEQFCFNICDFDSIEKESSELTDETLKIRGQLALARSTLTEKQSHIIYLRFVRGLSYKEIATVLDINVQSAMNSVNRAMAKLRSQMKKP